MFLLASLVLAASGCSVPAAQVEVLARVRDPSGKLDALHAQPRTGATVGFVEWVYVVPAGGGPVGRPVFVADKVNEGLKLAWSGETLTITAKRARVFTALRSVALQEPNDVRTATINVLVAEPVT